ncbi:carbonic anhydrase [Halalkalibacter nanhaiisediminis]|uniref:carbonic anhydrase n=1 Tax=Halalkalibacter nanhaiisediminis TaxID=688079 RepID=A0A562QMQ9_9BACI|nr:carbonic anhydrase family protein [Halalkalibacter nanhaiisediminis]TWI57963.1 carbonic anhydrase [Halalkalibacter nanhaiisediminis]
MNKKITSFFFIAFFALAACSQQTENTTVSTESDNESQKEQEAHSEKLAHWSYEGESGPEHWGELDPTYSTCVDGSEQSPINIEFSQVDTSESIENIEIKYEPASFSLVNNGHTVQANATELNNGIIVEGQEYQLVQFHFHTPSEHQFNGQHYDMELHLVHQDINGKLAVLGVMIQEGKENENLASVWDDLPKEETENEIPINEPINLQNLLPEDQSSFHYTGSLTTPPCTEEVKWIVFKQPIEMSKEQIQAFQEIFEENHRPVQPLIERDITEN